MVGATEQHLFFAQSFSVYRALWIWHVSLQLICLSSMAVIQKTLKWRHNGYDGVSNHQPRDCLLNRLFRRGSKKTSKLRVIGLCAGNSPLTGEFPAQMPSNAENAFIWWRFHIEQIVMQHQRCPERWHQRIVAPNFTLIYSWILIVKLIGKIILQEWTHHTHSSQSKYHSSDQDGYDQTDDFFKRISFNRSMWLLREFVCNINQWDCNNGCQAIIVTQSIYQYMSQDFCWHMWPL